MKQALSDKFIFATGIENSYPVITLADGRRKRVDEMEKTGHYANWEKDLGLLNILDVDYLRYGPPYYSTHTGPGKYDWDFADLTFARLRELNVTPIVDLCHFGVPDWIGNFQNPDFPELFAAYAGAFAKRFPHIRYYTPGGELIHGAGLEPDVAVAEPDVEFGAKLPDADPMLAAALERARSSILIQPAR